MELVKRYSRRLFFWIFFFMAILCALIDVGLYLALDIVSSRIDTLSQAGDGVPELAPFIMDANIVLDMIAQYYLPVTIGIFLLFALLMWLVGRLSLSRLVKKMGLVEAPANKKSTPAEKKKPEKDTAAEKAERERLHQRLFIHLFSVLQREGRLMDFFSEELDEYDDEQIGAAVRSIHESCNKTVQKYLSAEPVLSEEEDEEVTIEAGFDPSAIKLTGNVTGEPPFKGFVRHRGWKAGRLELPELSGTRDPRIIAPAEVEIE